MVEGSRGLVTLAEKTGSAFELVRCGTFPFPFVASNLVWRKAALGVQVEETKASHA